MSPDGPARRRRGAREAGRSPIYRQLAADLMAEITRGSYPVGTVLPKEVELSATYGVSRHTVREALRRLQDAGIVSRRRRAGTEVIATDPPLIYTQPSNSVDDLLQYAEGTRLEGLRRFRLVCDAALAAKLECEEGREWLCVETLRTYPDGSRPLCLTTNYLNLDLLNLEAHLSELPDRISAMLERRYDVRVTAIEQTIQAVALTTGEAALLAAEPGSPGLRAVRRYYDQTGRLLELSEAVHPGARFTYVMRLHRDRAGDPSVVSSSLDTKDRVELAAW